MLDSSAGLPLNPTIPLAKVQELTSTSATSTPHDIFAPLQIDSHRVLTKHASSPLCTSKTFRHLTLAPMHRQNVGGCKDYESGACLHNGEQRVDAAQLRAGGHHGHADHRQRRQRGDHARQVRRAARARDDHLRRPRALVCCARSSRVSLLLVTRCLRN